jgi:hypothetical protein
MSADHSATVIPRLMGVGSVIAGMTLIAAPDGVCAYVSDTGVRPAGVVRLLGVRYVVQGAAQLGWPRPAVLRGSAAVDGLHAASMVALAAASPAHRRLASVSAVAAAVGMVANGLAAWYTHGSRS